MRQQVDCLVIGAGMSGLGAADALERAGLRVLVVEAGPGPGGLARSMVVAGEPIEPYYHHVFPQDAETLAALDALGLRDLLEWRRGPMAILHDGMAYPFDGPVDLVRFPALSFPARVRFGMATAAQVVRRDRSRMDSTAVSRDAARWFGRSGYDTIWRPMLEAKFGSDAPNVAMAWLVARIRQRAGARKGDGDLLGYIRGGTGALATAHSRDIESRGVTIMTSTRVEELRRDERGWVARLDMGGGDTEVAAEQVIGCVSGPVLARMVDLPVAYRAAVQSIPYRGIVCVLLELRRQLSRYYWINVTDKLGLGCVGIIEHTNLVEPERYGGHHLVYLAHYVDRDSATWGATVDELVAAVFPAFRALNPAFDQDWIVGAHVSRDPFAQPVPLAGGPMAHLSIDTGLPGLLHASMAHVYPDDRGVAKALGLGARAAHLVASRLQHGA